MGRDLESEVGVGLEFGGPEKERARGLGLSRVLGSGLGPGLGSGVRAGRGLGSGRAGV